MKQSPHFAFLVLLCGLTVGGFLTDGAVTTVLSATDAGKAAGSTPGLEELRRDKRWLELLAAADQAMQSHPEAPDPMLYRVRALRMLGHREAARALDKSMLERFPEHAGALVEHAWLAIFDGDWPTAQAAARKAARLQPELAEAALLEGISAREQSDWPTAEAAFARADRLQPDDPLVLLNRGRVAVERGHWDAAIAHVDRSIKLNPERAEAFYTRGRALAAKGDLPRASRDFSEAIRLRPEAAAPYIARAELLGRMGAWARAAEDADTALALGAGSRSAHLTTCRAAKALEAWPGLEQRAQAMIKIFPDDAQGYRFLYESLLNQGRSTEALQACTQALLRAPDDTALRLERAALLISLQHYPAAVDDCTRALQQQPLSLGYALRGLAWLRQHDLVRAEENAVNALTLDPKAATALLILAEVRLSRAQHADALVAARQAVALAPQLSWSQVVLGKTLLGGGQTREAMQAANMAVGQAPDNADAYALRARCHVALGNPNAARADLTQLDRIDPALGRQLAMELAL